MFPVETGFRKIVLLLYLCTLSLVSLFLSSSILFSAMPIGGSDGKESACSMGDLGSILGLGRCPGGGMATHFSILVWKIPWIVEPGRLYSPWGHKELDTIEKLQLIPVLSDTNIITHFQI